MTEANLTSALCGFHKDVATIHKEARGNFGHYADLATVLSAVLPALSKNGLAITQTFIPTEGTPVLRTTLRHTSGETIDSDLPMIIGSGRNPLHDFGGATTYLRRYSLLSILGLAAGIEDDDGESAAPPQKAAPAAAKTVKTSPTPAQARPAAPKSEKSPAPDAPKPLPAAERDEIIEVLKHLKTSDAQCFDSFCSQYRKHFKLDEKEAITKHLQEVEHGAVAQQILATLTQP